MRERGSVAVYLLFAIVASIAAGVGAYTWLRDHQPPPGDNDEATTPVASDEAPPSPRKTTKASVPAAPVAAPVAEDPVPAPPPVSLAEQRAVDPIVDPNSDVSPVFRLAGIDGTVERGSVDRRFKPRAADLQDCFENNDPNVGVVRVTLTIATNGRITELKVSDGRPAFRDCIRRLFTSVTFSPNKSGATVVQPIAFR